MAQTDLAVEVSEMSVRFGDFIAVDTISFQVKKGEVFGFLGSNGAGKTTTIRVLCGLLTPTSGNAVVVGNNIYDGEKEIKAVVGYMSQKFTLYNDLTVEENLNFIAALRKIQKSEYLRQRKELLDFISFDRSMQTLVRDLPAGTKQHVSLAAALLHDPAVIFLDEPTAGVSPVSRALFWSLIKRLSQVGKTVFVTTHYMDEAEQCDRIALMRDGKIIALDTPKALKAATFSTQMYEFDPIQTLGFDELVALAKEPVFSFFEPYGVKFHACIRDAQTWEHERKRFEAKFKIRPINPSLEDVFIRAVETKRYGNI